MWRGGVGEREDLDQPYKPWGSPTSLENRGAEVGVELLCRERASGRAGTGYEVLGRWLNAEGSVKAKSAAYLAAISFLVLA